MKQIKSRKILKRILCTVFLLTFIFNSPDGAIYPYGMEYSSKEAVSGNALGYTDKAVYLSEGTYNSLNEADKSFYMEYCGVVDTFVRNNLDTSGFVAATDEDGFLIVSLILDTEGYFGEGTDDSISCTDESDLCCLKFNDAKEGYSAVYCENLQYIDFDNISLYNKNTNSYDSDMESGDMRTESFNTIMPDEYWFYNQLSDTGKEAYEAIARDIVENKGYSFSFKADSVLDSYGGYDAMNAYESTYPETFDFWDRSLKGTIGKDKDKNYYVNVTKGTAYFDLQPSPFWSVALQKEADEKIDTIALDADSYAREYYPYDYEYGVVEYVDNYICDNAYYNYNGTYSDYKGTEEYYYCHSIFGTVLNGYGVCESYALATSRVLDRLGIVNQYVVGKSDGGGHAWVHVKMKDGLFYLLDTTYDDSETGSSRKYRLTAGDSRHKPHGRGCGWTGTSVKSFKSFDFYDLSEYDYDYLKNCKQITMVKGSKLLTDMSKYEWTVKRKKIASLSKKNKLSALKTGTTLITNNTTGEEYYLNVVDKAKKLGLHTKQGTFSSDVISKNLLVGENYNFTLKLKRKAGSTMTAEILDNKIHDFLTCSESKGLAEVTGYKINGDEIKLSIKVLGAGKTKLKVKCMGKTANIKLVIK